MKKLLLLWLFFPLVSVAQSYVVKWGEETKLKKGSMDFDIINADESGVYVLEGKMKMKSYFVIGATYGTSYKLIKFDRNYSEVYHQDYKKLLKGLNFNSIQFLKKEMYLFADDYSKKNREWTIYGVRLDRNTGEPLGDMQELARFTLESKRDDFAYRFKPASDSSKWMLVGDISTETNTVIAIHVLDEKLTRKGAIATINLSHEPKSFVLDDLLQTKEGKYLLVGRQYEYAPTGKRKKTVRTFKKYVFSKYNEKGKKEMDLPSDVNSHYATSGKIRLLPNGELVLAGFYSTDPKKKEVNGVFIHRIDVNTGAVLASSYKEVSAAMLDQAEEDENELDDDDRKARKEREKAKDKDGDEDGISSDFIIRGMEYENGQLVLLAELSRFRQWSSTSSNYNSSTKSWSHSTTYYYEYTNSDLMVIKADGQGQINWINTLPKRQVETIRTSRSSSSSSGFYFSGSSFFASGGGMPFYSSFAYMMQNDKLVFLINDHPKNIEVRKLGDKLKTINNFKKSTAFAVVLDLRNGQFSRKLILSNEDDPVLMPRFAYVIGKDFYLPAMKMKALGKTQFKIGKISVRSL